MYKVTMINGWDEVVISEPTGSGLKLSSGVIRRKVNAIDSFTFSINHANPAWGNIYYMTTMIKVENALSGAVEFIGRVISPQGGMTEEGAFSMTVECEGRLGYLHDTIQRHGEYHNTTPREYLEMILNHHNFQTDESKRIYLGNVNVTNSTDNVYRYLSYDDTWDSIADDLVDSLGGYLFLRDEGGTLYLDYLAESGVEQEMSIELTKNMKSIENEWKYGGIITKLIPLGTEIESVPLAIDRLCVAGVITDDTYWLRNYRSLNFLGELLINLSQLAYSASANNGISNVSDAITFLEAASAIKSADYWTANYNAVSNLSALLIKAANRYDDSADSNGYADASKPKLTIAEVNDSKDYLLDESLVAEYGLIEGAVVWSDVTIAGNLKTKGEDWLAAQVATDAITLTALNLHLIDENYDDFKLGNYYAPNNRVLGVEEKYYQLTEQSINILAPQESDLVFGDRSLSLSGHAALAGGKG